MKLALLNIETIGFVNKTDKFHINYGDFLQNIVIKDLVRNKGISDIYTLDFNEISTYSGEKLLLPINQALSHDLSSFISKDIIPVFLGLSRDVNAISDREVSYLAKFSPIGCRDEQLFDFLNNNNVDAYLAGCITITLDKRKGTCDDAHPIFVDAPDFAIKNAPKEIKKNAEYLTNVFYGDYATLTKGSTIEHIVRKRYEYYKQHASVVITSRMHVASPCIGMGIPVIFVRNSVDYRLAWIDKFLKIYTEDDVTNINWFPKPLKIESFKRRLKRNAIVQIEAILKRYKSCISISSCYESRNKQKYHKGSFTQFAVDYINKRWSPNDEVCYSLWGMNDAADIVYRYITSTFPRFTLVGAYDSFRTGSFHGIDIQRPDTIANDNTFIFVTGYTASDAAYELFNEKGIPDDCYFLFKQVIRDNNNAGGKS